MFQVRELFRGSFPDAEAANYGDGDDSGFASSAFAGGSGCFTGSGGFGGSFFAAKSALNSRKVRSGTLPSIASCDNFGFGNSRRGFGGGGGGGGGP